MAPISTSNCYACRQEYRPVLMSTSHETTWMPVFRKMNLGFSIVSMAVSDRATLVSKIWEREAIADINRSLGIGTENWSEKCARSLGADPVVLQGGYIQRFGPSTEGQHDHETSYHDCLGGKPNEEDTLMHCENKIRCVRHLERVMPRPNPCQGYLLVTSSISFGLDHAGCKRTHQN